MKVAMHIIKARSTEQTADPIKTPSYATAGSLEKFESGSSAE